MSLIGDWRVREVLRPSMTNELRRAPRYSLTSVAEITDLRTGTRITAQTSDVSLVGCYVDTLNPLPAGTQVRIRITHENEVFASAGVVAYSSASMGMGIKFLKVQHDYLGVLRNWVSKFNRSES
jgi:hypothetical protein